MSRRTVSGLVCVLCLLVVVSTGAAAPVSSDSAVRDASASEPAVQAGTITQTFTVSLTPNHPGETEVVMAFDLPSDVSELTTRLPNRATVEETTGFESTDDGYRSTTDRPSIRYTLPANETTRQGYRYVDTGSWAIVPTPQAAFSYQYRGSEPSVETNYEIAGSGVAGRSMLFLGDYALRERTVGDSQFRLVVPTAAAPRAPPARILDTLATAADRLDIGTAEGRHVVIAAPTGNVTWGVAGSTRGQRDFWVRANQPVDAASNVWIHEYVHTRQQTETTSGMRWSIEGSADYYAALETLRQERITFEAFRRQLDRGTRYDDAVLATPDRWESPSVPYAKGRLVAGEIDRQIRLASDGTATLATALDGIDGELSRSAFYDAVERAGNATVRANAERLIETESAPRPWSRERHRRAFDGTAVTATPAATSTPTVTATATETTVAGTPTATITGTTMAEIPTVTATRTGQTTHSDQPGFGPLVVGVALGVVLVDRQK
ncbi:hypothetical protein BRD16_05945 [Halobacteriales archaeon SW_6_65_46]|nr:MAG: hypothetical protein BRD16_05945 [Halobacteriales archaeon SW_6_65_46]